MAIVVILNKFSILNIILIISYNLICHLIIYRPTPVFNIKKGFN